jgi:predicted permease
LFRSLQHDRGLAAMVVVTLALGIGTLGTAFGIVDAALYRPPPFPAADRLVIAFTTHASAGEPLHNERWSYPRLRALRERARTLSSVANFSPTAMNLTGTELTEPVRGEVVSAEYFATLQVQPRLGRVFTSAEDATTGGHPLVILADDFWRRRYGADPSLLGRSIGLNGRSLTVVGVMPPGFRGVSNEAQLWVPTTMAPVLTYGEYLTTDQNFISVIARMRDDATLESVRSELARLGPGIYRDIPPAYVDSSATVSATALTLNEARVVRELRRAVLLLFGAVALLHLLACANVASLLLSRGLARRRESAVRAAMGSSPLRLFARTFGEGTALCFLGGVIGLWIARLASGIVVPLNAWGPRNFYGSLSGFSEPAFGWRTIAFIAVVTIVTTILVSLAPAVAASRVDVAEDLRAGGRAASDFSASLRRPSARGYMVALESALAMMLLVAGGLMIDSFRRMRGTELGVDASRVLTFTLMPSEVSVPPASAPAFIEQMLGAISAVPGVLSASVDGGAPLAGSASSTLRVIGRPEPGPGEAPGILRHYVGPDHFTTLGIPLRRGRVFTSNDRAGQPRVAVISETAARRFWPDDDPIGQRVWFGGGSNFDSPDSSAEIVGIVGDVAYQPLDRDPNKASFYTPYFQFTYAWRVYFVRTAGDPMSVLGGVREAVKRLDPDLPLKEVRTLDEIIGASWTRQRFDAFFFGGFAGLALLLAASGIYAVVAYAVNRRRREMGIRLALGSKPGRVIALVMRQGMAFPALGLLAGAAGALALGRVMRGSLYGVAPADPLVFGLTIVVLLAVAAVACAIPARRATRVDPNDVLRAE